MFFHKIFSDCVNVLETARKHPSLVTAVYLPTNTNPSKISFYKLQLLGLASHRLLGSFPEADNSHNKLSCAI